MTDTTIDTSKLTDHDLQHCLEEMRKRGWAVAAYAADDLSEGPLSKDDEADVQPDHYAAFMKDNRDDIEDAMCEAVWKYCQNVELVGDKLEHV